MFWQEAFLVADGNMTLKRLTTFLVLMLTLAPVVVVAQEFSPRAYWPTPVGTRLLISGYSHSSGDVLLDPTIPIYGLDSRVSTAISRLHADLFSGGT